MNKFSFVIGTDYISETLDNLSDLELDIITSESDLELGYITIKGSEDNISYFKDFINGKAYI